MPVMERGIFSHKLWHLAGTST